MTKLLIQQVHEVDGHSGTLHVLANLRDKYWVVQGQ